MATQPNTCIHCSAPISTQSRTGSCRPCAARRIGHDPAAKAKRIETYKRNLRADPLRLDALRQHCREMARTPAAQHARRNRKPPEGWAIKANAAQPAGSEIRRRTGAKTKATKMAWCPAHLRETYSALRKKHIPVEEAKAMVLEQHEIEMRRWRASLPEGMRPEPEPEAQLPVAPPKKVREAAAHVGKNEAQEAGPTAAAVLDAVAEAFALTREEMLSKRRDRQVHVARTIAIRLLREERRDGKIMFSYPQIGRIMGGRDHTTALYLDDRFDAILHNHPAAREVYARLSRQTMAKAA